MDIKNPRILLIGFDPDSIAGKIPGIDPNALRSGLEESFARVKQTLGCEMTVCWLFAEDDDPVIRLEKSLRDSGPFDGLMVGWGVRGIPVYSALFERVVKTIRTMEPPEKPLMFSTPGMDHLETIRRNFPRAGT